ncbi:receptor-type tyrosine-protein phosphatase F [Clonorchis sinensis]|uniref:Receptor-type tyrosine-protein phosphatase F n=1 Tax=Clonorchis sinensis TaxID=79923 RepID=G7YTF5_CLOSI|nr:receptor-type tyrosine-protein phosphatase F [Clonorchis sinensis]
MNLPYYARTGGECVAEDFVKKSRGIAAKDPVLVSLDENTINITSDDTDLIDSLELEQLHSISYIESPAKIIEPPTNVKVVAGETALFFCRATGNPAPTVNFLLDRTISHSRLRVGVNIPDGSLLRLTKTTVEQNGMQVQCVARNHVGGDSAIAHLTVYDVNSDLPQGYPILHSPPKPTSATIGDVAQLECEVSGNPQPKVVWIKNEIPIPTNGPRISIVDTYFDPRIIDKTDQVRVRPGQGANLTCRATGNPIPSTRWLTDSENPITESVEGVATLFLTDVTGPARYICEANNSLGTVQHPVRIYVIDMPPPPANLKCLEEGAFHAFLQWYPPDFSRKPAFKGHEKPTIDSYTLFLTESNETHGTVAKRQLTDIASKQFHPDGALQYKVVDLKPYTQYSAKVVAVSHALGMSDPSNTVFFTTAEVAPTSAPLMVSAVALSDDTVDVTWHPPRNANGKITRYTVLYSTDSKHPVNKWHRIETNLQTTQIRNLKPMQTYFLKVAASNSVGTGPFSELTPVIVKFGVPAQPLSFRGLSLSPTQIFLNWTTPAVAQDITLEDYLIRYRNAPDESTQSEPIGVPVAATSESFTLENLTPNTTYHISIAARTKFGLGVAAQIQVRTASNVPDIPTLHELDVLDSSRIRIRWLAPRIRTDLDSLYSTASQEIVYRQSRVKHFLLQWAPFPFTEWHEAKILVNENDSPQHVYEHVIAGLLSRTVYKLRLGAVGSQGLGAVLDVEPVMTKGQELFSRVYRKHYHISAAFFPYCATRWCNLFGSGSIGLEFRQWPCRDLKPGHLTCEASVLPLLYQRTLDASEFSRLNRRTCSHLSDVISVPDPSNDDPVTDLVVTID